MGLSRKRFGRGPVEREREREREREKRERESLSSCL